MVKRAFSLNMTTCIRVSSRLVGVIVWVLIATLLAACASVPEPAPATTPVTSGKPVVVALATDAQRAQRSGKYEQAALYLERALRIEPNDPWLWHHLAAVRFDQKRFQQALNLAAKSNALAGNDHALQRRNYEMIADAFGALGAQDKAAEARRKARQQTPD